MKKYRKRIIAIILGVFLIINLSVSAFASEVQPRINFVATMKIVSFKGGGIESAVGLNGHAFLIFTNTSNSQITIGHFPVAPNDSITIGTFGNRSAHRGIWYNIEGCFSTSTTRYSLVTALTIAELQKVNETINNNDSWSITNNCSSFAVKVWNSGPSGITVSGWNPADLVSSIKESPYYTTNVTVPSKTSEDIARHTSSGYTYDSSGYYSG